MGMPDAGWYRDRHWRHSEQIVRSHDELELLIDPLQSTKHGLPDPAQGLGPAERPFDPFANAGSAGSFHGEWCAHQSHCHRDGRRCKRRER
jgi:hypothetical protein